ncbi:MAG: response regulator transcription factor [Chloroflexi bacterium]|nr:response regulator transcription factor [Chloroflexota bacterium]
MESNGNGRMRNTILVIGEGGFVLGKGIASALAGEGFDIAVAASSPALLSRLGELKPSLVILAEGLPTSLDVCSRFRRAVDVPILMIGSAAGDGAWMRAVEAGADFYLAKPFSYSELVTRVKSLLRRHELARQGGR